MENGISDFAGALRPATENICPKRLAGLSRSSLGISASLAKTKPPCAKVIATAAAQATASGGNDQRKASNAALVAIGVAKLKSELHARSVHCRKSVRQVFSELSASHNATINPAKPATADGSSRLRATCPFSRAFCRRRGVACSVLSSWAIVQ